MGVMADFRVDVVLNSGDEALKTHTMLVKKGWNVAKFKKEAGKRLGIKNVKRIFLESGAEITNLDEMQANSILFISQGEPFYKDSAKGSGGSGGAKKVSIAVLGSGGVGKSALTLRCVRDYFASNWDPTIEDAYRKNMEVDGRKYLVEILDTAGQDDFESLRPSWMTDKDGYIFVYSMDDEKSLNELQPFFELHEQMNQGKFIPIILAANKKDIVDADPKKLAIPKEQGMALAEKVGNCAYVETSAFSGENVNEIFVELVRTIKKPGKSRNGKGKDKNCIIS